MGASAAVEATLLGRLAIADRILRLAALCRKAEAEAERIMPFGTLPALTAGLTTQTLISASPRALGSRLAVAQQALFGAAAVGSTPPQPATCLVQEISADALGTCTIEGASLSIAITAGGGMPSQPSGNLLRELSADAQGASPAESAGLPTGLGCLEEQQEAADWADADLDADLSELQHSEPIPESNLAGAPAVTVQTAAHAHGGSNEDDAWQLVSVADTAAGAGGPEQGPAFSDGTGEAVVDAATAVDQRADDAAAEGAEPHHAHGAPQYGQVSVPRHEAGDVFVVHDARDATQEKTRGPAGTRLGAALQEAGRSAEHDAPVGVEALADPGGSGVEGGSVLGKAGLEVTGGLDLPAQLAKHLDGSASVQSGWCHALDEHGLPVPHERLLDNAYRRYNKARCAPCWDSSSDAQLGRHAEMLCCLSLPGTPSPPVAMRDSSCHASS